MASKRGKRNHVGRYGFMKNRSFPVTHTEYGGNLVLLSNPKIPPTV